MMNDDDKVGLPDGDQVASADGLLPRLMTRLFFRTVRVTANMEMVGGFHLITLEGAALCDASWQCGDKVQIKAGQGLLTRTYTPIEWDNSLGRTRFLAQTISSGPGTDWVRSASPGQLVQIFGPRRSLDLSRFDPRKSILVGDETSLGLAAAWRPAISVLEVWDAAAVRAVADEMSVPSTLIKRRLDGQHMDALVEAMNAVASQDMHYVLTGRATTIQQVLRLLRSQGVASRSVMTKAYWAEGKAGLD